MAVFTVVTDGKGNVTRIDRRESIRLTEATPKVWQLASDVIKVTQRNPIIGVFVTPIQKAQAIAIIRASTVLSDSQKDEAVAVIGQVGRTDVIAYKSDPPTVSTAVSDAVGTALREVITRFVDP